MTRFVSRATKTALALWMVALVLLLAGCGGDGDAASEGGEASGADSAQVEAARERVEQAKGEVEFVSPGDPIDASKFKGKSLWIVSADLSIPFHQNIVKGFEEGTRAAGLKPVKFDGKGQTAEFARGIDQAIAANAGGIALISIDTRFVSGSIKRANDAGVPVIGVLNTDARAEPDPGTAGEATIDYTGSGELLAAYAVANTDGPVNALYADVGEFRVMGFLEEGIYAGFKEYCPDACSIDTYDMQMANFKQQAQTKTQSELRRNPKTNWILSAFDAQALFVVRVGSINAVTANLQFILDENGQVVDVGNSNAWLGWAAVDRLLRSMAGEEPAVSEVPVKLFDKENLEGVDIESEGDLFSGADFRGEYTRLWGMEG
jgi:ribose transport system substrate-binding protein